VYITFIYEIMKFETVAAIIIGAILLGVLGGFAARSFWIGIGLPIVLIGLGLMWLAIKDSQPAPTPEPVQEEPKKIDTTQPRQ
jgi:hypothetical protein